MFSLRTLVSLVAVCSVAYPGEAPAASANSKPAFAFRDVGYFHRWSKNDQHEFTPAKQEDLDKWSDMITINAYPKVEDGEGLAVAANAVLENYKSHQGEVLKTQSVPRTADRPAEHLIVVRFSRPDFIEIAFARFKLVEGKGCSVVYSHRAYGKKIKEQMSAWLDENGGEVEKALMNWSSLPSPSSFR